MNVTDLFVRRPVVALVVSLVIFIAGLEALRAVSVRQYPRLDSATITVTTVYVGADANLVRGFVTTPLERAIAAADGIDYLESQSRQGLSTIQVRLKLDFPAQNALADISARIAQVRADLPPEAQIPALKIEPSDAQVAAMYLSFRSDILESNQVTDYLTRIVQPRLSALTGVQRAEILGGRTFALRAWLKPDCMAALGVSPSAVRAALVGNNALSAVGQTKGQLMQIDLTATTHLTSAKEFERLVVREGNGALVRLGDVATVTLGAEDTDSDVRFSGEQAVFMGVWVLPNANTLDVVALVHEELDGIQRELPAGLQATVAYDSTGYIHSAIRDVTETLIETVAIVMVVIFLFLGSLRTVLVPVVAIPLSLVGAVFLLQVMGFTLNLLTLLAIVLSVGLVVDDAIVVVENVERHVRLGQAPLEAALSAARELVSPIIAMTITLAAVYAPIGFQSGLTGALFREFAFTLAGAVFISGVVALTLSPMMSSRLVRPRAHPGWLVRHIDSGFEWLQHTYSRLLAGTLRARAGVYAVWLVLSALVVPLYLLAPVELAPKEDQGVVFGAIDVPANATLERLLPYTDQVEKIFASVPEFQQAFQVTTPAGGFGGAVMKPWDERRRSIFPIHEELSRKTSAVAGIRAPLFLPSPLPSAGLLPVELVIPSTESDEALLGYAKEIAEEGLKSGQFAFPPTTDVRLDATQRDVVIDKDAVASMGVSLEQVGQDLSVLLGGNFVNRFELDGLSYKVIPQVERAARLTPEELLALRVTGPRGQLVPLSAIASLVPRVSPRTLNRFQQLNAVKISGVAPRSTDAGLRALETAARRVLPPGSRLDYTGESRQLREEAGKFLPALALALALIFLVLAAQFDSFRDPLVILAGSVPLAAFGALVFAFLK